MVVVTGKVTQWPRNARNVFDPAPLRVSTRCGRMEVPFSFCHFVSPFFFLHHLVPSSFSSMVVVRSSEKRSPRVMGTCVLTRRQWWAKRNTFGERFRFILFCVAQEVIRKAFKAVSSVLWYGVSFVCRVWWP